MGEQKFCCHLPVDSCQTHLSLPSLRGAYHISLETLRPALGGFSLYSAEKHVALFNPLPTRLPGCAAPNRQLVPVGLKESNSYKAVLEKPKTRTFLGKTFTLVNSLPTLQAILLASVKALKCLQLSFCCCLITANQPPNLTPS